MLRTFRRGFYRNILYLVRTFKYVIFPSNLYKNLGIPDACISYDLYFTKEKELRNFLKHLKQFHLHKLEHFFVYFPQFHWPQVLFSSAAHLKLDLSFPTCQSPLKRIQEITMERLAHPKYSKRQTLLDLEDRQAARIQGLLQCCRPQIKCTNK